MDKLFAFLVLLLMAGAIILLIVVGYQLIFGKRDAERAKQRYKADLAQKFNGTTTVVWDVPTHNNGVLTKEQLIEDANTYGYDLDTITPKGRASQTLVFKKVDVNLGDRVAPYLDK